MHMSPSMLLPTRRILRWLSGGLVLGFVLLTTLGTSITARFPLNFTAGSDSKQPQRQVLRSRPTIDRGIHPRIPCKGPRGDLLDGTNRADIPQASYDLSGVTYSEPTFGSYEALNLSKGWLTFGERYGPYGYDVSSTSSAEDEWSNVDWANLQSDCARLNHAKFGDLNTIDKAHRLRMFAGELVDAAPRFDTGRQAIVLRTWSSYEYHPEDFWNLRSIITEASLATNGEYQVFLLVDLKCGEDCKDAFSDRGVYDRVLNESVPEEFRGLAVLFNEELQRSWYPDIVEYRSMYQIMQPFQLFAHFYPEFDHYWQIEMDARFTGHVGDMLQKFSRFGRRQPYKQARERASWAYMSSIHGAYDDFSAKINTSLQGGATIWGPDRIRDVEPIGFTVPGTPQEDVFSLGVGHDADLLLLSPLDDVRRSENWVFKHWFHGFSEHDISRHMAVPAQARASHDLLEAVHRAQHYQGLRIASEATLPSWALWLGLKVVSLPIPRFQYPERDYAELNWAANGGVPEQFGDGIANGGGTYRGFGFFLRPLTFDWWSSLCDPVFEHWIGTYRNKTAEELKTNPEHIEYAIVSNEMPWFMREVSGRVYVPEMIMHPRKSNRYHAPSR